MAEGERPTGIPEHGCCRDIAFSWMLRKMVLKVSKGPPLLLWTISTDESITDPLDGWSQSYWMDLPLTFSLLFRDVDVIDSIPNFEHKFEYKYGLFQD